jgi:hypothetical protein
LIKQLNTSVDDIFFTIKKDQQHLLGVGFGLHKGLSAWMIVLIVALSLLFVGLVSFFSYKCVMKRRRERNIYVQEEVLQV